MGIRIPQAKYVDYDAENPFARWSEEGIALQQKYIDQANAARNGAITSVGQSLANAVPALTGTGAYWGNSGMTTGAKLGQDLRQSEENIQSSDIKNQLGQIGLSEEQSMSDPQSGISKFARGYAKRYGDDVPEEISAGEIERLKVTNRATGMKEFFTHVIGNGQKGMPNDGIEHAVTINPDGSMKDWGVSSTARSGRGAEVAPKLVQDAAGNWVKLTPDMVPDYAPGMNMAKPAKAAAAAKTRRQIVTDPVTGAQKVVDLDTLKEMPLGGISPKPGKAGTVGGAAEEGAPETAWQQGLNEHEVALGPKAVAQLDKNETIMRMKMNPGTSGRSQIATAGQRLGRGSNLAAMLKRYEGKYDTMPPQIVEAFTTDLQAMINNGSPTIAGMEHMRPNSIGGDAAKFVSRLTGDPVGANQGGFIDQFVSMLENEEKSNRTILEKYQEEVANSFPDLKRHRPQAIEAARKDWKMGQEGSVFGKESPSSKQRSPAWIAGAKKFLQEHPQDPRADQITRDLKAAGQ